MLTLFRVPNYGRWLSARAFSWFGDTLMMLVLGMWVKTLTGSSAKAGVTMAFFMAPQLIAPFVGFVADRFPRRLILIYGNAFSALALTPLLLVHRDGDEWLIYVVAVLYGISGVVLNSTSMAMQRSITPDHLLTDAQALQQTIGNSFQILGPMAGAGLFALWGGLGPTAVSFACFIVAMCLFLAFRNPPAQTKPDESSVWLEMVAGLRHVWRTKPLLHSVVALLLIDSVAGLISGAMYSVTDTFGKKPEWAGAIVTAQGLGMVVGALLSTHAVRRLGEIRTMWMTMLLTSAIVYGASLAPNVWVFLGLCAAVGVFLPFIFVAAGSLQMRLTPSNLMGRVATATTPLFGIASVASMTIGSLLVARWSFREIYPIVAVGSILSGVYLLVASRRDAARIAAATPDLPVEEVAEQVEATPLAPEHAVGPGVGADPAEDRPVASPAGA